MDSNRSLIAFRLAGAVGQALFTVVLALAALWSITITWRLVFGPSLFPNGPSLVFFPVALLSLAFAGTPTALTVMWVRWLLHGRKRGSQAHWKVSGIFAIWVIYSWFFLYAIALVTAFAFS